jgi:hypothetical protein
VKYYFSDIALILNGECRISNPGSVIEHILLDSRKVLFPTLRFSLLYRAPGETVASS